MCYRNITACKNHLRLTRKMLLKLLILTVVIVDIVLTGDVSMDTAANCGTTTDIYDEVFTIRSHASPPNYRCVVTMNTGYNGTHAIEIISENTVITDCGVRLGIYDGANTDGHQLKIFRCTSRNSSGVFYSGSGTVTFELITPTDIYNTRNTFLLKVKSFHIHECQTGTPNCDQLCTNTPVSFTCSCMSGYTLQSDQRTCTDNNECLNNTGGCSQYCRNLGGSYECYCQDGLVLSSDNTTCLDHDECTSNNGGCDQVCVNEHATHRCECYTGYQLGTDGKSCAEIDEDLLLMAGLVSLIVILVAVVIVLIIYTLRKRSLKAKNDCSAAIFEE